MRAIPLAVACALMTACASTGFPEDLTARVLPMAADGLIEVALGADGGVLECEFHVPPAALPVAVLEGMDRVVPGGLVADCEVEYVGDTVYFEVSKIRDGRKMEVLFDASGRPVEWEIEIDVSQAPAAVLEAAESAAPGRIAMVEEIRDASSNLTAYHVKKNDAGFRYKISISIRGAVLAVVREIPAEIEVPYNP